MGRIPSQGIIRTGREDVKDYSRTARKLTVLLFVAQSLGSAGFIAATTVNAIVGAEGHRS